MSLPALTDASRSGAYFLPAGEEPSLLAAANSAGFRTFHVALNTTKDLPSVLLTLGKELKFPEDYGVNFDALYDCLTDPDWQPAPGHLILLEGLAALQRQQTEGFATLIDVLQDAAAARRDAGQAFWLLLDLPAANLKPLAEA